MKINTKLPPREFEAGYEIKRTIKDCGQVHLEPDEQLTFVTENGSEYDLARKDFGYYATPSLNGRLKSFNIRSALVKNRMDQFFVLLVEKEKVVQFEKYLDEEKMELISWLDETNQLKKLEAVLKNDKK